MTPDCRAIRAFARMCNDGWLQGWHERNGGNLTYRLTEEELAECRPFFREPGPWTDMGVEDDYLAGAYFLSTGSGKYMRNVMDAPDENLCILEINDKGSAWRIVWGLVGGGKPTSEFSSHYLCHCVRAKATNGETRVMYHAHPAHIVALTFVLPLTSRAFTRALWQSETECPIVFPNGVGVVEFMVPGGSKIARATEKMMARHDAVVWAHHGLFTSGPDFDTAFGLMHTIEKAAQIRILALSAGQGQLRQAISDQEILAVAKTYDKELDVTLL